MKYSVSEEGILALRKMSSAIKSSIEQLAADVSYTRYCSDSLPDVLGPHKASLDSALGEVYTLMQHATDPARSISDTLSGVAEAYSEIIDNDRLKVGDSGAVGKGTASVPFSGVGTIGNRFGSFETGRYLNGDTVIKGDHYDQYIQDYYDSDGSTYTSLGDKSYIESIPPSAIEGIHLGESEFTDSGRFWGQHMSGGTVDTFKEIASHIPEVKRQIEEGKSLSDVREDPLLEQCVDLYFDPRNMTRVVKNNGYYEFDSNGRHRILAARELGYDIPVYVIGLRTHK